MPRMRKLQSKDTSARREPSSDAEDLRSDCVEQLDRIISELVWFEEKNKNVSTSILGPRLNREINRFQKEARALIYGLVASLGEIDSDPEWVLCEAQKAWPVFNEKAKRCVSETTLAKWQRLALARARRRIKAGKKSEPSGARGETKTQARSRDLEPEHDEIKRGGRPRQDEERKKIREKRAAGKPWKQVTAEMDTESGNPRTVRAYQYLWQTDPLTGR
jgi:hypothetical protein